MAGRRASPGIGHNGDLPAHADIRTALAIVMIFEEEEKKLREKKKRAHKKIEGMGVRMDDLNFLKGLRDKTGSEVEELFRRNWHLMGAVHEDKHEQLELFAPKPSAPAVRAAHFTMGLLAGLHGKDLEIPPLVVGDDRQQMIDGHNEGMARRQAAWEAVAAADGSVVDGTGKTPSPKAAAKVAEQAEKDFAKDEGEDPLVVAGEKYKTMRQANAARARLHQQQAAASGAEPRFWDSYPEDNADWTEQQKDAFCEWFDKVGQGDKVVIEHPGAQAEFRRLRDGSFDGDQAGLPAGDPGGFLNDPTPVVGDDAPVAPPRTVLRPDFQSWSEDWLEWTGSQQMEFRRWFESLPTGTVPPITHKGAVDYYNALREEVENKRLADAAEDDEGGVEGSVDTPAAPAPQTAETPDPAEVEAAAKKLADSGFVPKKGRKASTNLAK